jgi:CRISPR/Cas system-associated endonuclease Cas3-HD
VSELLTKKQITLIERIVEGEETVKDILADLDVPKSTYYDWKKVNKEFKEAMDEAIELKVEQAKKNIRMNVNKYISRLDTLSKSQSNQMASINAITKLLDLAQLFENKSEITVKSDLNSEEKNHLLDLLGYETSNSQNSQNEDEDSQE